MQKLILLLAFLLPLTNINGQENLANRIKELAEEIRSVKIAEKEALKAEIEGINARLENNEINTEKANELKEQAAEQSAERIEAKVEALENEIVNLVEKTVEGALENIEEDKKVYDEESGELKLNLKPKKQKKIKGEPRTTSQFVFGIGFNTLINDLDLSTIDNDKFQISNARFYEFGGTYKTRVFAKSNLLHLKYGLSLRINNVRPNDNQYFVKTGDVTSLVEDPREYSKDAYFRTAQWVVPVYFEFDFTKPKKQDDVVKFKTQKTFRFGIGGYAGLNSKTRQVLNFQEDKIKYEVNARGNFNVNTFVYGLGAYIGYKDFSIYGKLDFNDLFDEGSLAYNNLSLGVRWDWN